MSWDTDDDDRTSANTTSTVTPIRKNRGRPRRSQPKVGAAWNLEDPETFDETLWYTRATDPTGLVGHTLHIKFPPDIAAAMGRIVETARHPAFKTKADIVRHYLVVGLHDHSTKESDPDFKNSFEELLRNATAAQRAIDYSSKLKSFTALLDSIAEMAKLAHQYRDFTDFREQLDHYFDSADAWREPLRSQLIAKLKEHETKLNAAVKTEAISS